MSLRRLAYNLYNWLAGLSRGLGLLMAYGGWWRLSTACCYKQENEPQQISTVTSIYLIIMSNLTPKIVMTLFVKVQLIK